jgi:hypothetical protein
MALRAWLWSVALPIVFALPAAEAQYTASCIQDESGAESARYLFEVRKK